MRLIAAIAILMATSSLPASAAETYRVAGVIVNASTGTPMPRARIILTDSSGGAVAATALAGPDGEFAFDLPKGNFILRAMWKDATQPFGLRKPDGGPGSAVITGPGQDTAHLLFRWFPRSAISGKVLDEYGEPVVQALVQLVRSSVSAGRRVTATAGWTRTDDRGEYRFGMMPAGSYYLGVTGSPWYSQGGGTTAAYAPVYYPNSLLASGAAPITLSPGEEERVDFVMNARPGGALTVQITGPVGVRATVSLISQGIAGTEEFQRQTSLMVGPSQAISGVPPGPYKVRAIASSPTSNYFAEQSVDVSGVGSTVEVPLRQLPTITGTVEIRDSKKKLPASTFAVFSSEDYLSGYRAAVQSDGSFRISEIPLQRFRVGLSGPGVFASEVHVEGAQFRDGVVDLAGADAATIRIIASDETGRLQGVVRLGESLVEGVLVVLAADPFSSDPTRSHAFQTDTDGSFDFKDMRAGNYWLFVADNQVEYLNEAEYRRYAAGAKKIRIEPHTTQTEEVRLRPEDLGKSR